METFIQAFALISYLFCRFGRKRVTISLRLGIAFMLASPCIHFLCRLSSLHIVYTVHNTHTKGYRYSTWLSDEISGELKLTAKCLNVQLFSGLVLFTQLVSSKIHNRSMNGPVYFSVRFQLVFKLSPFIMRFIF